jgi:hypothetical protein
MVADIKKYMKAGIFIMAIMMAMTGLMGCQMAGDNITNKIEDGLKNELGEEFKVFWLQGSNFDTEYEAYVSPVSNPDIRFTVYTDGNGKLEHFKKTSYYSAKVWNDFAQEIIKAFDTNGIEAFCKAQAGGPISAPRTIPKITSLNTTVKEYINTNPTYEFSIDVILNESDAMNKETLNKIVKVLEKENEVYPGICIYGKFYFYDDEGYSKSKAYFERTVTPSDTILRKYGLKNSCLNGIKDNKVNESVEEMLKDLEKNNNTAR